MISLIKKPIVSEKASKSAGTQNTYHFKVDAKLNKLQIKFAVEKRFDVKVKDVRTLNYKGKPKRMFTKKGMMEGNKSSYKKALVRLKEGFTLDLYSTAE